MMIRGFILGLIAGSFVALGISTAAWAGRKVAVIVDGGDDRGSSSFRESAEVINQTYLARSRGYQVVRIEAVKGDGIADFHAAFSKLGSDVDELEIVLLAHGVVVPDSRPGVIGADDKRIPKSFLRPDEVSSQLTDDYGPWKLTEGIYFGYHLAPPPKPNAVSSVLGVGDLRRAILEVKNKNPNVPVTVSSLTCYGGNAIRALDTIPGTQVFTSTSSSQYYWTVSKGPDPDVPDPQGVTRAVTPEQCGGKPECLNLGLSNSYLLFFHQALDRGASYLEAHKTAKRQFQEGAISLIDFLRRSFSKADDARQLIVSPQSSFELTLEDHCLGAPPSPALEPPCFQFNPEIEIERMTKQVSHLAVWEEVRATMDAQKAHLERAWDVLACEPSVRQLEKDALIAAFREVYEKGKAKTAKLSQSDLDREIGVYEAEIVAIQNIRTPEELSRWKQDESNVSAEAMKASKFFDVFLKQKKESWVAERRAKIEKLKSPQALEQARGEGARLIQEIERFHVPSCLKGERIGCNTQHFDYMGKALFSKSHRQLVTESERLGAERCAIGRFASENRTLSTGLKQRQIDCILRETRTDPELRLYALRRSALSLVDEEYAKACQGVAEAQALQRKLSACVDKPETARNQTLADQLRLLLLQGSRKAK